MYGHAHLLGMGAPRCQMCGTQPVSAYDETGRLLCARHALEAEKAGVLASTPAR